MNLTNLIRTKILNDLLAHAFLERAQGQINSEAAFATEVFEHVYAEHLDMINAAPDGFFPMDDSFKVAFGYEFVHLDFGGGFYHSVPSEWKAFGVCKASANPRRRVTYRAMINESIAQFDLDHPLAVKYAELKANHENLDEEICRSSHKAKETLAAVSSVYKLIKVWPEARAIAERYKFNGEAKAILPDAHRQELNAALKLPATNLGK